MDNLGKRSKDTTKSQLCFVQDNIKDVGNFDFWNGDKYNGEYLATKQPLSIVREGQGTYWASDGSVYKGHWNKDLLEKADEIIFQDKSTFFGSLDNMIMDGPGTYTFKEGVEIHGFLINNQFAGGLKLTDPTGHCWTGLNPDNESEVYFYPQQPFWQTVVNLNNLVINYSGEGEDANILEK